MISPNFAFLNLTYACNNRCRWCYVSPADFKKDMMKPEDAKRYLKVCKSMKISDIGFIGGEPTMHPDLFELIRFTSHLGLKVSLYTNGRRLADPEFIKELEKTGVHIVQFNIQSAERETHDEISRVCGSFEETLKGIENWHKTGMNMRLLVVMCHKDFEIYQKMIDRFAHLKVMMVFFREIPPVDRDHDYNVLSNRDTAKLVERIFRYSKRKGVRAYFYLRMPLCWYDKTLAGQMLAENTFANLCHITKGSSFSIDVEGNILPCVYFVGYPMFGINEKGKISSKDEILKKWNSIRIGKLRAKLRRTPNKECTNCSQYGINCVGGCPLLKFELGPYASEHQNPMVSASPGSSGRG
ncbi:MAG: radical SAM protein [Candidatus Aenigmatarchaeota archaeon]|nr:MAG: radical SAM protein [Candidatus Aenigmarchaeota archaeon]